MHLHTYRDESRSRHFDLIGGRGHPWSIDLVTVTSSGILVMGFTIAIAAFWIHYPTAPPFPPPATTIIVRFSIDCQAGKGLRQGQPACRVSGVVRG